MKHDTSETDAATASQTLTKKRVRLWLCARIVDYRFQALAVADPTAEDSDHCWSDIGPDTLLSDDREAVFQLGRANGGLLLGVDGLPNGARLAALAARAKATAEAF